jgi:hypothetical protein
VLTGKGEAAPAFEALGLSIRCGGLSATRPPASVKFGATAAGAVLWGGPFVWRTYRTLPVSCGVVGVYRVVVR